MGEPQIPPVEPTDVIKGPESPETGKFSLIEEIADDLAQAVDHMSNILEFKVNPQFDEAENKLKEVSKRMLSEIARLKKELAE